jgi:hypothetical protein
VVDSAEQDHNGHAFQTNADISAEAHDGVREATTRVWWSYKIPATHATNIKIIRILLLYAFECLVSLWYRVGPQELAMLKQNTEYTQQASGSDALTLIVTFGLRNSALDCITEGVLHSVSVGAGARFCPAGCWLADQEESSRNSRLGKHRSIRFVAKGP